MSPSQIEQYLKGRSSQSLQEKFPELKRQYYCQHMWEKEYFCGTVGKVDKEMIKKYIENREEAGEADNFKIEE